MPICPRPTTEVLSCDAIAIVVTPTAVVTRQRS